MLFMFPRRFTLRDGRKLEIRVPFRGPFVVTLDGEPLATIERPAMKEWNSIRLDDGAWLQVRAVRDTGRLHFDVAVDQQRLPGSLHTVDWRLRILALLLACNGCNRAINTATIDFAALRTRWHFDNFAIGATFFLLALAVRQRSRMAFWAAVLWFTWLFVSDEYTELSHGSLGIEVLTTAAMYLAWRSLKALDGKDPDTEPLAP